VPIKVSNGKDSFDVDESRLDEAQKDGFVPTIKVSNGKEVHDVHPENLSLAKKDGFYPEQGMGEKVTRSVLKALPFAGTLAGGAVGAATGAVEGFGVASLPMAAIQGVAGAGLGAGMGESAKNMLEHYLFGDEKTKEEILKGPALAIKDGAMNEMGGQIIGAVPGLIKGGINSAKGAIANKFGPNMEYTPVANKEAIEAAAKKLNINDVPKAVLTDNPLYHDLESSLSQSATLPAKSTRDQYNAFRKGIDDASTKLADLKTPDSDFSLGKGIQQNLADSVNKSRAPVSEMYQELVPHMQKIPVSEPAVNQVFGTLKRNPLFQTKDGAAMLDEYKNIALSQPELASLKEWRSTLGDSVGPSSAPIDAKRMDALQRAVTSIRDNSINALKNDLPKNMHGEVDDLIGQITLADQAHASNMSDINSVKGVIGNRDFKSPVNFLNKLGETKEADLAQRVSNLDVGSLRNLQSKFPDVFEQAKTAKVNDMVQRATNSVSGFNEANFIKQYNGLDKEMKDLIFTPEIQAHVDALTTLKQAIPEQIGKSGTPKGMATMDMFGIKRNLTDLGMKQALDYSTKAQAPELLDAVTRPAIDATKSYPGAKLADVLKMNTGGFKSAPAAAMNAADNKDQAPAKGESKWAKDGFDKAQEHDSSLSDDAYKQLIKTKQGRDLLIKASDSKPGTKAMDKIVSQVKTIQGIGDE
jgi:hypothetical protein